MQARLDLEQLKHEYLISRFESVIIGIVSTEKETIKQAVDAHISLGFICDKLNILYKDELVNSKGEAIKIEEKHLQRIVDL